MTRHRAAYGNYARPRGTLINLLQVQSRRAKHLEEGGPIYAFGLQKAAEGGNSSVQDQTGQLCQRAQPTTACPQRAAQQQQQVERALMNQPKPATLKADESSLLGLVRQFKQPCPSNLQTARSFHLLLHRRRRHPVTAPNLPCSSGHLCALLLPSPIACTYGRSKCNLSQTKLHLQAFSTCLHVHPPTFTALQAWNTDFQDKPATLAEPLHLKGQSVLLG